MNFYSNEGIELLYNNWDFKHNQDYWEIKIGEDGIWECYEVFYIGYQKNKSYLFRFKEKDINIFSLMEFSRIYPESSVKYANWQNEYFKQQSETILVL